MPGYGHRYWDEHTAKTRRRAHPALHGDRTADAVVIGGGLTGCTAAYVLAAAGLDVVLVDAERLATGATAGGLGAIVPQPDAWFRDVASAAGLRAARTAWQETRRSALEFASALKRLSIACDLDRAAVLVNAWRRDDGDSLRREQAARKAAGVNAPWFSAAAARVELGTDSFGALRLPDGFVFDPVRAALGLAAAAAAKGAEIFEQSPVRRTRFTRKYADVILERGTIRTTRVVVATGGPGSLFSQLRRHVREHDAYAVVTAPLSAAMKRETGARAAVMTEAPRLGESPHWLRWLADGRALFAGGLSPSTRGRAREPLLVAHANELMYELSVRYPIISGLPAEWGWRAPVTTTLDGLPWIGPHRNYPFHFFALALGWHGDALAWHAAKAALRCFDGEPRREDEAFGFVRHLG